MSFRLVIPFKILKTMKSKIIVHCCSILIMITLFQSLFAGNETYSVGKRGNTIIANSTMQIQYPKNLYPNWKLTASKISVKLEIAEDRYVAHDTNDVYLIKYKINLVHLNGQRETIDSTLKVVYQANGTYADIAIHNYPDCISATLTVTAVYPTMDEDIVLSLELSGERDAACDTLAAPASVIGKLLPINNELQLTWAYLPGADNYEVEWLFVDNPHHRNHVPYDFRNASRIETSNNFYNISTVFPAGNILFRVRGTGTYHTDTADYPLYGTWSFRTENANVLPMTDSSCHLIFYGMEDSLTWQYSAAYAEEGKRKEVISFYDGTLRHRQQVTLNNTDHTAIVSETFYDYVGREAVQSLAAPTPSKGIRYYGTDQTANGNFNGCFPKSFYDTDSSLTSPAPFDTQSGRGLYYSSGNPFLINTLKVNIAQTPSDSGYLYTRTRYLNDGTNRTHSVSGIGNAYSCSSANETRFYYGNPSQQELDRLFGNEVGFFNHYQKVLTVDPNGVTTVAYYDMKERLIASAIAQNADSSNLLDIDNAPKETIFNDYYDFDQNSRLFSQSLLVATPAIYKFTYKCQKTTPFCLNCETEIF